MRHLAESNLTSNPFRGNKPLWRRNSPGLCFLTGGPPFEFAASSFFCPLILKRFIIFSPCARGPYVGADPCGSGRGTTLHGALPSFCGCRERCVREIELLTRNSATRGPQRSGRSAGARTAPVAVHSCCGEREREREEHLSSRRRRLMSCRRRQGDATRGEKDWAFRESIRENAITDRIRSLVSLNLLPL